MYANWNMDESIGTVHTIIKKKRREGSLEVWGYVLCLRQQAWTASALKCITINLSRDKSEKKNNAKYSCVQLMLSVHDTAFQLAKYTKRYLKNFLQGWQASYISEMLLSNLSSLLCQSTLYKIVVSAMTLLLAFLTHPST